MHTSEQFANRRGVPRERRARRQTDRRERQTVTAAPTMTTSTCVKPADSVNMIVLKDSTTSRHEVQNDAMYDLSSEQGDA